MPTPLLDQAYSDILSQDVHILTQIERTNPLKEWLARVVIILLLVTMCLASCTKNNPNNTLPTSILPVPTATESGVEIPFVNIDRNDQQGLSVLNLINFEPSLIVLNEKSDISLINYKDSTPISQTALQQLQTLDFTKVFVIAVFQGHKPSTGFGVDIQKVMYDQGNVIIYVHLITPGPDETRGAALTSPYQLIKINKGGLLNGKLKFTLNASINWITQQEKSIN